jgi:NagD protein
MTKLMDKKAYICDMDGVIYHGNRLIDGVREFVDWLKKNKKKFLFLTNSSAMSPRQLKQKFSDMGIEVTEDHFMTSALATASFLQGQHPGARVYAIGESGLMNALHDKGLSIDQTNPDYVVVGETRTYNYEQIEYATRFVLKGAKLIGTNPDVTGPSEAGIVPACRALISPIELATDKKAYFIGKPNPLIMRHAIKKIKCRREETLIIGDRMDTDIIAGIESEIETLLVLTGITTRNDIIRFPYQPNHILDSVVDIIRTD